MFTVNAFGQRVPCRPLRLRYLTAEEEAAASAAAATAFLTENGFPQNTKVEDMQPLEQAAYWRNQSKVQQKRVEGIDLAKLQKDSEDLEKLRKDSLDEQQRAVEEAREEARREGENIGAERYLKDAVKGRFQALTGKTDEEVDTAFEHVDPKSFTDDKGAIDAAKLKTFAEVFGPKGSTQQPDPVAAALARQRAAGGGAPTSIAEKRKETRESLTKTKA